MSVAELRPLRYPTDCHVCGSPLERGALAQWDREARQATCSSCVPTEVADAAIDRGRAGESAAREWKRRRDRDERRVREQWGPLAGVALALHEEPQSVRAWATGSNGERELGRSLDALRDEGMGVLHDRRIPGSRANIDHLVIAPSGVFIVDAKNYRGLVENRDKGGWFSVDYRLYVGGRDRTKMLQGLERQRDAVRAALGEAHAAVPIWKTICFVDADWPFFAAPLDFDGVHVLWPRELGKRLRAGGPLDTDAIRAIERTLALTLLSALPGR